MKKNAKKSVCYRVCDRNGWSKWDSLEELEASLKYKAAKGCFFWPIRRIVRVVSEEIPLSEAVLRYNEAVEEEKKGQGLA